MIKSIGAIGRKTRLVLMTSLIASFLAACSTNSGSGASSISAKAVTSFVESNDTRYAYRKFGEDTDVPLVMMIRYRANMDDWDPAFLDALAAERTVIIFNQSGIASSTGDTPNTIEGMAADVAAFADALEYEQIDILGWSMAGFTAQAITIDYPDLVRRTVIIGSGPAASPNTPPPNEGVFDVALKPNREDGETTYSDDDRSYLFFTGDEQTRSAAAASFARIDEARRSDEPVTGPEVQEAQTAAIQHFWFDASNGYFDKLDDIQQPVLIVNGDRDAFFKTTGSDILHNEIPNSQLLILPMAGHGPQHQFPELVAEFINGFLD